VIHKLLALAAAYLAVLPAAGREPPPPLAGGLKNPESVVVAPNGKVYVTAAGASDKPGGGAVMVLENGKFVPFATGLDDPRGLAAHLKWLYVADRNQVWKIDEKGKATVHAPPTAFPTPPAALADVVVDPESGTLYVADAGDGKGNGGAVYRVTQRNGKAAVTAVADAAKVPGLHTPAGLAMDGASHVLLTDSGTGTLYRVKLANGSAEKVADGLGGAGGLAWDHFGRLFVSDRAGGKVFVIPRPGEKPVLLAEGFRAAADLGYDPANKRLLVPDPKAGTLTAVPAVVPGAEVDETPLPVQTALAFPDLKWTGWSPETETGQANVFRPLVLTHAGDGSNRIFLATQYGVIHVFPNDPKATATKVFLDISNKVKYDDKTNEEGFLGLAFHPRYKETGEFFVFYTPRRGPKDKLVNVVCRYRVSKDDPDRADPDSEEVLMRFEKPYWNHDGGTVCFGPDGMLYVTHGDGGLGNDPHENGQNLGSLLGKVHRIDADHKESGKNYAIPKDNPFVGVEGARPEIWAYGLRNIWRMSFDRKTGKLWASDVGQNLYEEIDLIERGGNYGWNRREGLHPFGAKGRGPGKEFVEPIWEYHHDVGKSLTGGTVYRGTRLPELEGHYLYGDYVTTKIWAMRYDEAKGRVVANRPIKDRGRPILSFGEDEKGEVYLLTTASDGRGIFTFVRQ
jgi:glucose/arabinose dehydrogenase